MKRCGSHLKAGLILFLLLEMRALLEFGSYLRASLFRGFTVGRYLTLNALVALLAVLQKKVPNLIHRLETK